MTLCHEELISARAYLQSKKKHTATEVPDNTPTDAKSAWVEPVPNCLLHDEVSRIAEMRGLTDVSLGGPQGKSRRGYYASPAWRGVLRIVIKDDNAYVALTTVTCDPYPAWIRPTLLRCDAELLDLHCQKIERTLAVDSYRLTASTPLRIH